MVVHGRRWRRRRRVHRNGRDHRRRRDHDRCRSGHRHDRRRAHYVMYKCRSAKHGPGDAPAAMVMVVVMPVVECGTAYRRASTPEPAVESAWTRTGEHHSCRCHGCQHYYQFLVHVYLLFLSLSTSSKANSPMKPDTPSSKNFHSLPTTQLSTTNYQPNMV